MSAQYGPHSSGARRLHTGSHPITETTCDDNQCWCHPPRVRNSLTDYRRHDAEAARNAAAPPLYTQAQVDALVAAAKGQVSPSTRPCCANCTHWDGRPYNWNTCRGTKGATTNGDGEIRTHAHFLCVEYRPLKGEPVTPAMFSLDAKDNLNEEWHEKTAASWRDTLEGK